MALTRNKHIYLLVLFSLALPLSAMEESNQTPSPEAIPSPVAPPPPVIPENPPLENPPLPAVNQVKKKPAIMPNIRMARNVNRSHTKASLYAENLAFILSGVPLIPRPLVPKHNRTVMKLGKDYLLQIINGNDPTDVPPSDAYFVIEGKDMEFSVRSQDGQLSEGSRIALHVSGVEPEEIKEDEVTFFGVWLSVTKASEGRHPVVLRVVFKNGTELKRNAVIVVE